MDLDIAIRIVPANRVGEDRAAAFTIPNGQLLVLADGAGGTSGGAAAAPPFSLVQASPRRLPRRTASMFSKPSTAHWLSLVTRPPSFSSSLPVGLRCQRWRFRGMASDGSRALDLTEDPDRKPLLGSGRAKPAPFGPYDLRGRVLLGSDGLFKYVTSTAFGTSLPTSLWQASPILSLQLHASHREDCRTTSRSLSLANKPLKQTAAPRRDHAPPPSRPW